MGKCAQTSDTEKSKRPQNVPNAGNKKAVPLGTAVNLAIPLREADKNRMVYLSVPR